eukprot:3218211-Pleurochrysis_carterae.AAC.2
MAESVKRISSSIAAKSASEIAPEDLNAGTVARSFVLSADMAHAVHPNYLSKHERAHGPKLNSGLVIKSNANQRYASNPVTSFVVRAQPCGWGRWAADGGASQRSCDRRV